MQEDDMLARADAAIRAQATRPAIAFPV